VWASGPALVNRATPALARAGRLAYGRAQGKNGQIEAMERYTVLSTMKNEGPFLLEWIAHYRALGFDDIVVCTNDCEDGTDRMLRRLQRMGLAQHHPTKIRKGGIHRSALRQGARYDEVTGADWVFICDVDEFLNVHAGDGSVRALAEASGRPDVISVPWRIFGSGGVSAFEDRPVTAQFTRAEPAFDPETHPDTGKFVKSLFRPSDGIARVGLHVPIFDTAAEAVTSWVLPGGTPYRVNGETTGAAPVFDVAQVNHYALRSAESYLVKRDRGRANHSHHVLGVEYWDKFDRNEVEDTSIRRYDARVAEILTELRADPRLARLHRLAVAWHRTRTQAMRADPRTADLVRHICAETA